MKFYIVNFLMLIGLSGNMSTIQAQSQLSPDSLAYEYGILLEVLNTLHPGLYRFQDQAAMNTHLQKIQKDYKASPDLKNAFLNLNLLTHGIQCGHTYPNFWNQNRSIQKQLFNGADKLPFTFSWVEDKLLIQQNLSDQDIKVSSFITSINGQPSSKIMKTLLKYSRGDGNNIAKRLNDLSINGQGKFEAFDILFPMLFPTSKGIYNLEVSDTQGKTRKVSVKSISREVRKQRLSERYNINPLTEKDLWNHRDINENTAYLKLGSFAVWKMKMNWKEFLKDFFKSISEKQTENLILDIRGNEGGLMEVYWELFSYLTDKPLDLPKDEELVRYTQVPEKLRPYLSTWEGNLFDISKRVEKKDERFYRSNNRAEDVLHIKPSKFPFKGNLIVLMDAANSSATFYLSKFVRENQLGTLVGEPSGGNLMGTNGGLFFMLRLPYTGLEIDIPLIGYYPNPYPPKDANPDRGLNPDHFVERNLAYYLAEEDLDIQKALEILEKK